MTLCGYVHREPDDRKGLTLSLSFFSEHAISNSTIISANYAVNNRIIRPIYFFLTRFTSIRFIGLLSKPVTFSCVKCMR